MFQNKLNSAIELCKLDSYEGNIQEHYDTLVSVIKECLVDVLRESGRKKFTLENHFNVF